MTTARSATKSKPSRSRNRPATTTPTVTITHPERIVYPDDGITKGDLAEYYEAIAERMLPHIAERPLSLVRCPSGTSGDCFFQKHPPPGLPAAVGRVRIREKSGTDTYATVRDRRGLLTLVQFNAMEIHVWGSRVRRLERPDRMVFDLDPAPGVAWSRLVEAARLLRELFRKFDLTAFVKTTGGKGLHVAVPLRPEREWDEVKAFTRDVAALLERTSPDRYTSVMSKAKRTGKIFIDYLRNERGATWVAPFSARARSGAPVSMPLRWSELNTVKSADEFNLLNYGRRLQKGWTDPWRDMDAAAGKLSAVVLRSVRSV